MRNIDFSELENRHLALAHEYAANHANYFTGETSGQAYDAEYQKQLRAYLKYWEDPQ